MDYKDVLEKARGNIGPYCKACAVCNGKACGNSMPGPGSKGPGNGAARNYDAWQNIFVNMDTICSNATPDTSFKLFGREFGLPIFTAPIGALPMHYSDAYDDFAYNDILIPTAVECGSTSFTGDGVDPEIMKRSVAAMVKVGGVGVPTIKPWNNEAVFEKLDILNEQGIFAAAMDIDGAGLPFLKAMNPNAGSKPVADLKAVIDYAKMPFIVKGIMTASTAFSAPACWARPAPLRTSCPTSPRLSAASASCSWTAASGPAWTCSRPLPWARTQCSSAAPSSRRCTAARPRAQSCSSPS